MNIPTKEERSKVIYVAGAMTGIPEFNFPAFNAAADKLRAEGWTVHNPADHGAFDYLTWEDYMAYDLTKLGLCGAIYMLKGWQMSRGACLEQLIAQNLNYKIIYEENV